MSMCPGKRARLSRIIDPALRRATVLALDHGFTMGPLPGLERIAERLRGVDRDALDAIVVHQGMVPRVLPLFDRAERPGLVVHLSGATQLSPDVHDKRLVCTVEHAIRLGADAVSIHTNLGAPTENEMIADLARVSEACQQWGVPLLAMMYPRRADGAAAAQPDHVAHAIRIAMELGADLVKVPYTGSRASFARALEGVDVPVLVAGGARLDSEAAILGFVDDALHAGASGVTFGRNIFQSADPLRVSRAVSAMVHGKLGVEGAAALVNGRGAAAASERDAFPRHEQVSGTFSLASEAVRDPTASSR